MVVYSVEENPEASLVSDYTLLELSVVGQVVLAHELSLIDISSTLYTSLHVSFCSPCSMNTVHDLRAHPRRPDVESFSSSSSSSSSFSFPFSRGLVWYVYTVHTCRAVSVHRLLPRPYGSNRRQIDAPLYTSIRHAHYAQRGLSTCV